MLLIGDCKVRVTPLSLLLYSYEYIWCTFIITYYPHYPALCYCRSPQWDLVL